MKKIILLAFIFPLLIFAQEKARTKADKKFEKEFYVESTKLYENLVKKGETNPEILQKIADAYYFNADYVKANEWYAKLFENPSNAISSEYHYRYAQTLKSIGQLEQSKAEFEKFKALRPNEIRTQLLTKNSTNTKPLFQFEALQLMPFNTKASDYGVSIKSSDTLVFASARPSNQRNTINLRTQEYYTNLYTTTKGSNGQFTKPTLFSKASYSPYHEATPVFTNDGKTMYYSQNQMQTNSKKELVNGGFKIYKAVKENGNWQSKSILPLTTNDSIRVAHPALSPDGKYLYFASDMQGSYGQSDLFKVALNGDGTLGKIEHLSKSINTEGRETYPFITKENILIFASDGHPGLGGLDLFAVDLSQPNATVRNLGKAINSAFDDFDLKIDPSNTQSYFTSNRPNGTGNDDIYGITAKFLPDNLKINLKGTLLDEISGESISGGKIILLDENKNIVASTTADSNGYFDFGKVSNNATYQIQVQVNSYLPNQIVQTVSEEDVTTQIKMKKEPVLEQMVLDKLSNIVYFNIDKWNIRKDAKVELDKVVAILKKYPTVNIEIGSHTDSREAKRYNQQLSQKRSNSILQYLVKQGIDKNRLTTKGYGESQLTNNCSDGIKCSEAQHQLNRRSTFIIKK
ncbi:flagellar motor protein MotB [Flavobacterium alvei]|uniref:Flagellar motor protein MotB n=1 Tax=Flavobacterium alvei TaxID=2080416 RepID=A0A2S4ZYA8_9FLAO|nr:OmpA family protein [Flavobacterium alvei]POY35341.1 flagellar motor protein MotB [Flavobacterium alvei]